jgi:endonuclease/exonuclease/phosphatase family metal-dependent hydrolase
MYAVNYKAPFVPYPIPPFGKMDTGIYTASAFRCQRADRVQLPIPFKWPVSTVNFKRCLLVTRVRLSGSEKYLVLINLHLEGYDVEGGKGRTAQTKKLLEIMQKEYDEGNYVIVGGDFNQTFTNVDTTDYRVYEDTWQPSVLDSDEFEPDFTPEMDPTVPTCRSLDKPYDAANDEHQFYVIDGFIYSDNVKLKSMETKNYGFVYSDHNPVVAEFVLK